MKHHNKVQTKYVRKWNPASPLDCIRVLLEDTQIEAPGPPETGGHLFLRPESS